MKLEMNFNNLSDDSLRCEYYARVIGRYVESRSLEGIFDIPLALVERPIGISFYSGIYGTMFEDVITQGACVIFREFLNNQHQNSCAGTPSGAPGEPAVPLEALHDTVHQDDLRFEASIQVFGRNLTLVSYDADFTMPGALVQGSMQHYLDSFREYFTGLFLHRAGTALHHFFGERQLADEKAERQKTEDSFVDEQTWNFGSQNLTSMAKPEKPAEREAA
jgi:hypothetical protein